MQQFKDTPTIQDEAEFAQQFINDNVSKDLKQFIPEIQFILDNVQKHSKFQIYGDNFIEFIQYAEQQISKQKHLLMKRDDQLDYFLNQIIIMAPTMNQRSKEISFEAEKFVFHSEQQKELFLSMQVSKNLDFKLENEILILQKKMANPDVEELPQMRQMMNTMNDQMFLLRNQLQSINLDVSLRELRHCSSRFSQRIQTLTEYLFPTSQRIINDPIEYTAALNDLDFKQLTQEQIRDLVVILNQDREYKSKMKVKIQKTFEHEQVNQLYQWFVNYIQSAQNYQAQKQDQQNIIQQQQSEQQLQIIKLEEERSMNSEKILHIKQLIQEQNPVKVISDEQQIIECEKRAIGTLYLIQQKFNKQKSRTQIQIKDIYKQCLLDSAILYYCGILFNSQIEQIIMETEQKLQFSYSSRYEFSTHNQYKVLTLLNNRKKYILMDEMNILNYWIHILEYYFTTIYQCTLQSMQDIILKLNENDLIIIKLDNVDEIEIVNLAIQQLHNISFKVVLHFISNQKITNYKGYQVVDGHLDKEQLTDFLTWATLKNPIKVQTDVNRMKQQLKNFELEFVLLLQKNTSLMDDELQELCKKIDQTNSAINQQKILIEQRKKYRDSAQVAAKSYKLLTPYTKNSFTLIQLAQLYENHIDSGQSLIELICKISDQARKYVIYPKEQADMILQLLDLNVENDGRQNMWHQFVIEIISMEQLEEQQINKIAIQILAVFKASVIATYLLSHQMEVANIGQLVTLAKTFVHRYKLFEQQAIETVANLTLKEQNTQEIINQVVKYYECKSQLDGMRKELIQNQEKLAIEITQLDYLNEELTRQQKQLSTINFHLNKKQNKIKELAKFVEKPNLKLRRKSIQEITYYTVPSEPLYRLCAIIAFTQGEDTTWQNICIPQEGRISITEEKLIEIKRFMKKNQSHPFQKPKTKGKHRMLIQDEFAQWGDNVISYFDKLPEYKDCKAEVVVLQTQVKVIKTKIASLEKNLKQLKVKEYELQQTQIQVNINQAEEIIKKYQFLDQFEQLEQKLIIVSNKQKHSIQNISVQQEFATEYALLDANTTLFNNNEFFSWKRTLFQVIHQTQNIIQLDMFLDILKNVTIEQVTLIDTENSKWFQDEKVIKKDLRLELKNLCQDYLSQLPIKPQDLQIFAQWVQFVPEDDAKISHVTIEIEKQALIEQWNLLKPLEKFLIQLYLVMEDCSQGKIYRYTFASFTKISLDLIFKNIVKPQQNIAFIILNWIYQFIAKGQNIQQQAGFVLKIYMLLINLVRIVNKAPKQFSKAQIKSTCDYNSFNYDEVGLKQQQFSSSSPKQFIILMSQECQRLCGSQEPIFINTFETDQ